MAIVIEEEKNSQNLVRMLAWIIVVVIIVVAIYYIFFAAPELVVVPPPSNFQAIAPISQVTLQPDDVLNSPSFKALLVTPPLPLPTAQGPASVGRTNPFVPD